MRANLIPVTSGICFLATLAMVAQDLPPDEFFWASRPYLPEIAAVNAIRVQSNLVEVPTLVLDSKDKPVGNLKKDDFLLFDNGKPQTISIFSVFTEPAAPTTPPPGAAPSAPPPVQPRYVALFFDDVSIDRLARSAFTNLNMGRDGAIKYIRKGLAPGERVGIFTASGSVTLDFTDDSQKLLDTLARLKLFQRIPDQEPDACPLESTYQAWVILNFGGRTDELVAATAAASGCCPGHPESCAKSQAEAKISVAEGWSLDMLGAIKHVIHHLGEMAGRRVLVLASRGFITLSFPQKQQEVVEAALRANVVINSLSTLGVGGGWDRLSDPLAGLAEGTGGKFFHGNNDLGAGFTALSAAPKISYLLGFAPENLKPDGSMHSLKVKLTGPEHLKVNARPSYYAPSTELSPAEKRFNKLNQSVMAASALSEIPVEFTAVPEMLPGGDHTLKVSVHVDVRKIPFEDLSDKRKVERLIFITALFDTQNRFLTGVEGVMDLRLREATLKQLIGEGLTANLSIQAPAGSYRVRQVVQEAVNGHISALNRPVEIQ